MPRASRISDRPSYRPDDPSSATGTRRLGSKDPWQLLSRAVFELVPIEIDGRRRSVSRLDAYHLALTRAAAQGDTSATKELLQLMHFLDGEGLLQPKQDSEDWADYERRSLETAEEHRTRLQRRAEVFLILQPEFKRRYEDLYGELPDFDSWEPDWLDLPAANRALRGAARKQQNPRDTPDYGIGYRKPPVSSRFKKGASGNPSGKAARRDDAWELLRASILKQVDFTAGGKAGRAPSIELICAQLFAQGCKGERAARPIIRRLIRSLYEKNLLVPRSRSRRVRLHPVMTHLIRARSTLDVIEDMIGLYATHFGRIDPFETALEQQARATLDHYMPFFDEQVRLKEVRAAERKQTEVRRAAIRAEKEQRYLARQREEAVRQQQEACRREQDEDLRRRHKQRADPDPSAATAAQSSRPQHSGKVGKPARSSAKTRRAER